MTNQFHDLPESVRSAISRSGATDADSFHAGTEQSLATVRARIAEQEKSARTTWLTARRMIPLAAAASLFAYIGWNKLSPTVTPAAVLVYETTRGVPRTFSLPDGSEMILAPASKVEYLATAGERRIKLDGQAYFRVHHDERVPFVVSARNALAKDIGTEFAVRAYPEDPVVSVAVAEGIVDLSTTSGSGTHNTLTRGDVASIDAGMRISSRRSDISAFTSWASGKLVFENAPIAVIARDLSRWFNVEIGVDPQLAGRRLSGVYDKPALDDVLAAIALTAGAHVERSAGSVRLMAGAR